jgi:malonyl-CoA O-methyltransferase
MATSERVEGVERAERSSPRPLDTVALAQVTRRLLRADSAPWLHGEVARRMVERLPVIRLQPRRVVEWGAHIGASHALLAQAYPQARLLAVEPDAARRDATAALLASPWWSPRRWAAAAPDVVLPEDLAAGAGELLWANMTLHGAPDPQAEMRRWQRALAVDGFLMFSTLGPGSLAALRALYAAQGWPPPFAPFVDMHDLGDMLAEAGFADPVMDQEQVTLTWTSGAAALAELRTLGGNVDRQRQRGLRTPRWQAHLASLLEAQAQAQAGPDGRVALGFEIVYGHAFRPAPRPRLAAQTTLPLDDMRAMVRAGRR